MESQPVDLTLVASDLPSGLATFTRLLGRPISADALFAGIPIHDKELSLDSAIRAAQRAGFSATLFEQSFDRLESNSFPCLVSLTLSLIHI